MRGVVKGVWNEVYRGRGVLKQWGCTVAMLCHRNMRGGVGVYWGVLMVPGVY